LLKGDQADQGGEAYEGEGVHSAGHWVLKQTPLADLPLFLPTFPDNFAQDSMHLDYLNVSAANLLRLRG
jgi:hypothetical protein